MRHVLDTAEYRRLNEPSSGPVPPWRRWGCYVADRSWGTVREDYSATGDAWSFISHEKARSKAYRWGEDAIAGLCDRYQLLVFAPAFWNGKDPILKERFFGLTSDEGNHGEDVKEYYFHLDNTPTHSYMRMLYKYPQAEFPYAWLVEENRRRRGQGREFELLDTGIFDEDRYFDVFIEYAKATPEDICIRIEACNRAPQAAPFHMLPHLWFRNTWSWEAERGSEPSITLASISRHVTITADDRKAEALKNLTFDYRLGERHLYGPPGGVPLFTDNETNASLVWGSGTGSESPHVKDAFHRHVIHREPAVNRQHLGTRACIHYETVVPAHGSVVWRLRLTPRSLEDPLAAVDDTVDERRREADEFYDAIHPPRATADERLVQRQALAGLMWTKQIYLFDVTKWLDGDNPSCPPPSSRTRIRNVHWRHLNSMRIVMVPDKWEYPWFAAWDLAFHCVTLALVDPEGAKENLWLLLLEQFQHPNGQIPACEWEFSDVNPPVHAWACLRVYSMEKARTGRADRQFLERCFHKLLLNFVWWINKVDSQGLNVFEGGFLGLDNITVIDRSRTPPDGAVLEQSDGSGWMGFYSLGMMKIALELATENRSYETMATKFFEHFVYICHAMKTMGGTTYQLWDEDTGFFYDVLRYPDGSFRRFNVRSLVGVIPLFAIEVIAEDNVASLPAFLQDVHWFIRNRHDLIGHACFSDDSDGRTRHVLSIVDSGQFQRVVARLMDPAEFLSDAGIRSLSKHHDQHPFVFGADEVRYEAAETSVKIKCGNSNWRGPIWFPTSFLLIDALVKFDEAYSSRFSLTSPVGTQPLLTPLGLAREIADRMIALFTRGPDGRRLIYGTLGKFDDIYWRDLLLFHEYFDGDSGAGLGANHQTGWTALVANLIDEWRR